MRNIWFPNISFIFVKYILCGCLVILRRKKKRKNDWKRIVLWQEENFVKKNFVIMKGSCIDDCVQKIKDIERAKEKDALVKYNENAKKNNSICPNCYRKIL